VQISGFGGNPVKYTDPDGRENYDSLNKQEKKVIYATKFGTVRALSMNENRKTAEDMTRKQFNGRNSRGDRSDAHRHAFFSAINTLTVFPGFTQAMGDAHEYSTPKNEISDIYMDIHNNDVGQEVALQNPGLGAEELSNIIMERIERGDLLILDGKTGQLYWSNDLGYTNPVPPDSPAVRRSEVSSKIAKTIQQ
jgi:hypothetical protein